MSIWPKDKELLFTDHHDFYYFTDGTYGPTKGRQHEILWTSKWRIDDGQLQFKHESSDCWVSVSDSKRDADRLVTALLEKELLT